MSRRIATQRELLQGLTRIATGPQDLMPTGEYMDGNSSPQVYNDHDGARWLGKPSKYEFPAHLDVATSGIQQRAGLPAAETHMMDLGGRPASVQRMFDASPAFPDHKVDISQMDPQDVLTLQKHMALDWMLSNHDAHSGNFLRDNTTGDLVGIDKGQAFKYFGQDNLTHNFGRDVNPPLYPNVPVYSQMWSQFGGGQGDLHDPRAGELGQFIQGLQGIPDEEYANYLRPYAESAAGVGKLSAGDPESFLSAAIARKNNLTNDFGSLYDQVAARRPQMTAAILRRAGVVPGKARCGASGRNTHQAGWAEDTQRWLGEQPQKWQDFYRENPRDLDEDYYKLEQYGVDGLSTAGEPGKVERKPYYPADRVNPQGGSIHGDRFDNPRPRTPRQYIDNPDDMLDLEFEDGQMPREQSPVELWRGKTIDLTDPAAAEIRAILRGSDDGHNPFTHNESYGQQQLYAPEPVMNYEEYHRAHGPDTATNGWPQYYRNNKNGQGGSPVFDIPPGYEHPELGNKILDYLSNDPNSGSSLGRHWSTDSGVADEFAGTKGPKSYGILNNKNMLPVRMRGKWKGLGEDPQRTNTGASDMPEESEVTMLPGAPMDIHDLEIWHPDHQKWVSVLPGGPQSRTATLTKTADPTYDLYQKWKDAYDSGGSKGKFPDWFDPSHYGDQAYEALDDWLKQVVSDDEWEEWENDHHGTAYDNSKNSFQQYLYDNDIPATAEEEKQLEHEKALEESAGDYSADGHYIPGPDYDPEFEDRPILPGTGPHDERRYYSPNALNPESGAMSRPYTKFEEEEPDHPMLPLNTPAKSGWEPEYEWPKDRKPIDLYRGVRLNLNHPELGEIRRSLFGDFYEGGTDGGTLKNKDLAQAWGKGKGQPGLDGVPTDLDPFTNPELGRKILDHIEKNYGQRSNAIGRHWSVERHPATDFATSSGGGKNTGQGYGGPAPNLPVRIRGQWGGLGEDPYRSNTGGDFEEEREITMLPGAPINIADVEIQHPHTKQWHSVLDMPHPRTASLQKMAKVSLPYLRNNNGMRQHWTSDEFGQVVEPWGRYMSPDSDSQHLPLQRGWERGSVDFDNPLYVPHEYGAWKQKLSEQFGGLTGHELSQALLDKGHDGVITHDKFGLGEIVDIRPKDQRGHRVALMGR